MDQQPSRIFKGLSGDNRSLVMHLLKSARFALFFPPLSKKISTINRTNVFVSTNLYYISTIFFFPISSFLRTQLLPSQSTFHQNLLRSILPLQTHKMGSCLSKSPRFNAHQMTPIRGTVNTGDQGSTPQPPRPVYLSQQGRFSKTNVSFDIINSRGG